MNTDKNPPLAADDDDPWESLAEDLFGMPFGKEHSASDNVASAAESAAADRVQAREVQSQSQPAPQAEDTWDLEPKSGSSETAGSVAPARVEPSVPEASGFAEDLVDDADDDVSSPPVDAASSAPEHPEEAQGRKSPASAGDSYWDALAAWSWDDSGRSAPPPSTSRSSDSGRDSRRPERPPRGSDSGRRPERRSEQSPRGPARGERVEGERAEGKRPSGPPASPQRTNPARAEPIDEHDDFGTGLLDDQSPGAKAGAGSSAPAAPKRDLDDDVVAEQENGVSELDQDPDDEGPDSAEGGSGEGTAEGADRKRRRRRRRRGRSDRPVEGQPSTASRSPAGGTGRAAPAGPGDDVDSEGGPADSEAGLAEDADVEGADVEGADVEGADRAVAGTPTEAEREARDKPARKRRPRRRRRGDGADRPVEATARRVEDEDEVDDDDDEQLIDRGADLQDEDEDDEEAEVYEGGGRGGDDADDDDQDLSAEGGDGDEDDEDSGEHVMTYTNVPTWEEAISYLLRPNQIQVDPAAPGSPPSQKRGGASETGRNPTRHYGRRKP